MAGKFFLIFRCYITHNLMPMAIRNCRDRRTSDFLGGKRVREFEACAAAAARALTKLQAATRLYDLRNPPSNQFEALRGDRRGEYSIRVDRRWRVCFRWAPLEVLSEGADIGTVAGEPYDVEISDHYG
jgi:proteic killer suppression protein